MHSFFYERGNGEVVLGMSECELVKGKRKGRRVCRHIMKRKNCRLEWTHKKREGKRVAFHSRFLVVYRNCFLGCARLEVFGFWLGKGM